MRDESGPAFPVAGEASYGPHPGMTYRQWLVGQALVGMTANTWELGIDAESIAMRALRLADAVIAAEKVQQSKETT